MIPKYNPNYEFLHKNWQDYRFFLLQGSSRSGKTYSIYDFIIWMFYNYKNAAIEFDVTRASLVVLKATVVKEFIERLKELGFYDENKHNMSEQRIEIFGNYFNYYSVDTEHKARGRKRAILWLNEPNSMEWDIIYQLLIRTSHKIILDFNPSEPVGMPHWIYDELMPRANAKTLVTTYKDNPHLPIEQVLEIESAQGKHDEYFDVFGRGQRPASRKGQVFTHFKRIADMPSGTRFYGLDFGKTNDPTSFNEMHYDATSKTLSVNELIYQTGLTSSELAERFKQLGVSKTALIYADNAEPLMIKEIASYGYNIHGAVKGSGSVQAGIDKLKSINVNITESSVNLWKEVNWYSWQLDKAGNSTNEPIDLYNHGMDSMRYGLSALPAQSTRKFLGGGQRITY